MLNREQKNEGWICPKCGVVNAPWKATCDCTDYQYVPIPYNPQPYWPRPGTPYWYYDGNISVGF